MRRHDLKASLGWLLGQVWQRLPTPVRRLAVAGIRPRIPCGVLGLVADGEGRVLFLDHRFRRRPALGLPGGFLERGEEPAAALSRELLEETGYHLRGAPELFSVYVDPDSRMLIVVLSARLADDRPPALAPSLEVRGGTFLGPADEGRILSDVERELVRRYWATHPPGGQGPSA